MLESVKIDWSAPLRAKGQLKIIEMVCAVVALSLVVWFTVEHQGDCVVTDSSSEWSDGNFTTKIYTKFPFTHGQVELEYRSYGRYEFNQHWHHKGIPQGAQFFVGWASLTVVYGVIAILVYTIASSIKRKECLVWMDTVFNVLWAICWIIAAVVWSVIYKRMERDLQRSMDQRVYECRRYSRGHFSQDVDIDAYTPAATAVIFAALSAFLWTVNIGWVLVDTQLFTRRLVSRENRGKSELLNTDMAPGHDPAAEEPTIS